MAGGKARALVALWAGICVTLPTLAAAQEDAYRTDLQEQVRAQLFVVPLRIEDPAGGKSDACTGITPDQLDIYIRGKAFRGKRKREAIERGTLTLDRRLRPMLHALVLDTSGSMSLDLEDARRAARGYVERMDPNVDFGMVVGFDDGVTLWQGVTGDRAALTAAVDAVGVGGQTSLFDALVAAIRELDSHQERPVIVLLSDGGDNASFYEVRDVLRELERRPDITVFSIALGRRSEGARQLLRELARATQGKYFEVERGSDLESVFTAIRETLGTEVLLTIADPDPDDGDGSVEVELRGRCQLTVLGSWHDAQERKRASEPILLPTPALPHSISSPVSAAHRKILESASFERELNRCVPRGTDPATQAASWRFEVRPDGIDGCAPDITVSHGYLYDPEAPLMVERNPQVTAKLRPFHIETSPVERLPRDPQALIDLLLEHLAPIAPGPEFDLPDRPEQARRLFGIPAVVGGTTFLEMRPRIARALFLHPHYQQWALARLHRQIERELRRLESRYRLLFPDAPEAAIELATDQSDEAAAIRLRGERPSEVDLQPFLAAWLGDVPARELFEGWEVRAIQRLVDSGRDVDASGRFLERWGRLHRALAAPAAARVVAALQPIYDESCDCIGFYRILLPRPSLLRARLRERTVFQGAVPLDLPPRYPFGYALLDKFFEQAPAELRERLAREGYTVQELYYELLGPAEGHDPRHAFRETRVVVALLPDGGDRRNAVVLDAALHAALPPPSRRSGDAQRPVARWMIDRLDMNPIKDDELRKLVRERTRDLVGVELLERRHDSLNAAAP